MRKIAIIGAGMSGMIAAIYAAQNHLQVVIFERLDRVGKKLLLTGNGKCNLSNESITTDNYITDSPKVLNSILTSFSREQEEQLFQNLGILTKVKNGCIYPVSNQASTVLDALRIRMKELSIEVKTESMITKITKKDDTYSLCDEFNKIYSGFSELLIATGGLAGVYQEHQKNGYPLLQSLGYKMIPSHPALVQTICSDKDLKVISGVRSDVVVTLFINGNEQGTERGELQITEKGLSGIAVFQLTRRMDELNKHNTKLRVDFLPALTQECMDSFVKKRYQQMHQRTLEEFMTGMIHKKLIFFFLRKKNWKLDEPVSKHTADELQSLLYMMKNYEFEVLDLNGYQNAQISTGGVALEQINPEDMSSKKDKHVYITGEALNVAGECGGYNLHFAMASGYLAGSSIARREWEKE